MAVENDQGRSTLGFPENPERMLDPLEIIGIADTQHVPAASRKTRRDILGEGDARITFDRDGVALLLRVVFPCPRSRIRAGGGARSRLENSDELAVTTGDLVDSGFAGNLSGAPVRHGIPKDGAADGKADEAGDAGGRCEPFTNLGVTLAAPKNDAANGNTTIRPCRRYDLPAILSPIEALDLPHVRFDAKVLKLFDGADHQSRSQLPFISSVVASELVELCLFRGNQQLEHEPAPLRSREII